MIRVSAILTALCLSVLPGCMGGPKVGTPAPAFAARVSDGTEVSLNAFEGDVLVLDFFATWCPNCRKAAPHIQALHEAWSANDEVRVVGVHFDDNYSKGHPTEWAAEHGFTFEIVPDGRSVAEAYNIEMLPAVVVVGRDGRVLHKQWNFYSGDVDKVTRMIREELWGPDAAEGAP
ncbi:MAG: TlpA family protein disulfide reductase [Phycisphaerales bacterium JB040]